MLSNVESNEDSVITGNSVEPPSKKPKKKDKVTELDKSSGKKQKSKITTGPKQTNGLILYCMENRERLVSFFIGVSKCKRIDYYFIIMRGFEQHTLISRIFRSKKAFQKRT